MNLTIWTCIVLMVILTVASLFDILNNHIIPIIIPVVGFSIRFIELSIIEPKMIQEYLMIAILVFVMMLIMCYFGNLGGADCLLGTVCALYIGLDAFWGLLFSFIYALPYALNMKIHSNEHEYAFAPYIWIGMLTVILLKTKGGF